MPESLKNLYRHNACRIVGCEWCSVSYGNWRLEPSDSKRFLGLIFTYDDETAIAGLRKDGTSPELRRKGGDGKYRPFA